MPHKRSETAEENSTVVAQGGEEEKKREKKRHFIYRASTFIEPGQPRHRKGKTVL